jgi:hypothetical protein
MSADLPAAPTPQTALFELALFSLQELLRHAPELFASLTLLFQKESVTLADIDALRAEIAATHYKDLVPGTAIPPAEQT